MKDNNILILLICFIVLTFVVYFYINNNMLVTEDFTSFEESAARNYEIESDSSNSVSENDDYRSESNHMNSIIAKYSGKMLNIIPVGQPKTKKCIVPFYDKDGKKAKKRSKVTSVPFLQDSSWFDEF